MPLLTWLLIEHPPHECWHIEAHCLNGQNEGHPLVVVDLTSFPVLVSVRDQVPKGYPVSVLYPTVVLGVLFHGFGELCRNPTFDGMPDVLLGWDEDGKDDDHGRRVVVVEAVDEVVVDSEVYFTLREGDDRFTLYTVRWLYIRNNFARISKFASNF